MIALNNTRDKVMRTSIEHKLKSTFKADLNRRLHWVGVEKFPYGKLVTMKVITLKSGV